MPHVAFLAAATYLLLTRPLEGNSSLGASLLLVGPPVLILHSFAWLRRIACGRRVPALELRQSVAVFRPFGHEMETPIGLIGALSRRRVGPLHLITGSIGDQRVWLSFTASQLVDDQAVEGLFA